jgi:hypothetical protein
MAVLHKRVFLSCGKMNDRLLEQCINIKFCTKLGKSASGTLQMLTEEGLKKVGKT